LIAIEVKYQSDINYEKDVGSKDTEKSNIGRLNKIKEKGWNVLFAILIKESKWGNMGNNKKRIKNYIKDEKKDNNIPLLVLFWKDILEILKKHNQIEVTKYLEKALEVKKAKNSNSIDK
jgi:hypothetical protein